MKTILKKLNSTQIIKYSLSSLSASLIDMALFQFLCHLLRGHQLVISYVLVATILAKIVSGIVNYHVNYYLVFKSHSKQLSTLAKYSSQLVVKTAASGLILAKLIKIFPGTMELLIKIPVELALFVIFYYIQKKLVYKNS